VTINQAAAQADPTNVSPINFTVTFNEAVTGFTNADVVTTGSTAPGVLTAVVTGGGTTYTVAISGMTGSGTVLVTVPANAAIDTSGNGNLASTSTDNVVTYDVTVPTVTINQAAAQADPTGVSPINFTVIFSEPVTGFTGADITLTGTAGATTSLVTGGGTTYNVAVSGMAGSGTVIATVNLGAATDVANNTSLASTSTDNTVTYDSGIPSVTINQAAAQVDPTNTSPINFTVVFSETVTGFTNADVVLTGTAGLLSHYYLVFVFLAFALWVLFDPGHLNRTKRCRCIRDPSSESAKITFQQAIANEWNSVAAGNRLILAGIRLLRIPQRELFLIQQQAIDQLDSLHQRMILVGNLIFPAAKTAARIHVSLFKFSQDPQSLITI
jgi:hypothetical protein